MIVCRTRDELADGLARLRDRGRVALVPTMGYLHEGHLSLVDVGREAADAVVVSIFVNPLQFGPSEDLDAYPRDEDRDRALLAGRDADLVFIPGVDEMYPGGEPTVTIDPGPMARGLCGAHRPGHFRGVLTVVARLFGLFQPDTAVFGRKDYQQAVLIRRMARDLELGVEILLGPIVREADGLAMSSRNGYLNAEERAQATGLHDALVEAVERFRSGERSAAALAEGIRRRIHEHPLLECQYAELVDPSTLERVGRAEGGTVAAVAAFCGTTRLIDNVELR
ncbi:MAG: pantoate--beta-alanine ligase [Gemmatimonadota bacterium]